jgi:hypothetical protein
MRTNDNSLAFDQGRSVYAKGESRIENAKSQILRLMGADEGANWVGEGCRRRCCVRSSLSMRARGIRQALGSSRARLRKTILE